MTADEAYSLGLQDGQRHQEGAIGGKQEHLVPDDVYPAYVRGVRDGVRQATDIWTQIDVERDWYRAMGERR